MEVPVGPVLCTALGKELPGPAGLACRAIEGGTHWLGLLS